jgi:hypothetical protein
MSIARKTATKDPAIIKRKLRTTVFLVTVQAQLDEKKNLKLARPMKGLRNPV